MVKNRKVPLRKCVITNERFEKKDLIRVVRDKTGVVSVDLTGRANGRGAYLKRDKKVIEKAIKTKKLERHLEVSISQEVYDELLGLFDE